MAYYTPPYMQPFGGGYPMYGQQTQIQPQTPQQLNNGGILWVQGEAGAKAWAVAPGQSVTLMDSESPALYLKSADMSGVPSMRIFDLVERTPQSAIQPKVDMSKYVTREEFEALKAKLTTTQKKAVKNDVESSV